MPAKQNELGEKRQTYLKIRPVLLSRDDLVMLSNQTFAVLADLGFVTLTPAL